MYKNKPILITGCQRSGTTLLSLILDSHPKIHGVDEVDYRNENLELYLRHSNYHPQVVFKLPSFSSSVESFKLIPGLKVLWCIRDCRDVVSSMLKLSLRWNHKYLPRAVHPNGALREIKNCEAVLQDTAQSEVIIFLRRYHQILDTSPCLKDNRDETVFIAALCWRLKQELLRIYDTNNIEYQIVKYENLIEDPESEVDGILQFLDIPWNDDVLEHHRLHSGFSIGYTSNTEPIDKSNQGKWKKNLTSRDLSIIDEICLNSAHKFNYFT